MKKLIAATAIALSVAAAGSAFASGKEYKIDAPRDQWMTTDAIKAKFKAEGYDVRKVKEEKGVYEVYAIDPKGAKVEQLVHPVTGEILGADKDN
ncbi:PepSY domain-containing protein [Roseibium litorale]|uniref:PepSY domain-containing protein n=1 Tax=Roseibium litorale TaxID=2803841 RepID=A0ABR9CTD5_9HYPH|nr:PepSY domain-containing protein [Roseibium litorale]MBD8893546.1 PepSY domain-containing protein [Roseibium litorale]